MPERVRRSFISVPLRFPEIVYMTVYVRSEKKDLLAQHILCCRGKFRQLLYRQEED